MRNTAPLTLCLVSGILLSVASAQGTESELVQVNPEQIGLSESGLEEVTRYLQGQVDDGNIAAAVGMVARHGKIGYFESVGEAAADDLFRLASMTKAITSVGVMQLAEAGEIQLNDPLSKYLPAFKELKAVSADGGNGSPVEKEPTIHQLLTHTSGIGYGWWGGSQDDAYKAAGVHDLLVPNLDTLDKHTDKLSKLPLAFEPGTQWMYGQSLDVLGRVIEVVSGLTLQQYFHERIFRPLKMNDTRFYLNEADQKRLTSLFTPGEAGKLLKVGSEVLSAGDINFSADAGYEGRGKLYSGGSGLIGSTMDYMRFLQMLLNGGILEGVRLLKESTVQLMTKNHIGDFVMPFPNHGDGFGYGFGVLTERGKAVDVASVGSYSWGGIFNTYYWVDPQEELIGLVMTQIFPNDHLTIRENFKQQVYQAIDDSGFVRRYWYEQGEEHANPVFSSRQLRVNSAGVVVHPNFSTRKEVKSSGLARIFIEEDLRAIKGATLYTEIWGGHPGTSDKKVSINGRTAFSVPEIGTADYNCTHQYPSFRLSPSDLVDGYNSIQFSCYKPGVEWGHFIVENVALDIHYPDTHPNLVETGISGFTAEVSASSDIASETIRLQLDTNQVSLIEKVVFQARYYGYDENGDGFETDWHGMTYEQEPFGVLGVSAEPPFSVNWDVSMLPAQDQVEARAIVYFKNDNPVFYRTKTTSGLEIAERGDSRVILVKSSDLPKPFWSRANRLKEATIQLDVDPAEIEEAELHIVSWTGGAGEVKDYFTLNGTFLPVAEGHGHQMDYSVIQLDTALLKKGENRFQLLSDTVHHGIEILLPGPALIIRTQAP